MNNRYVRIALIAAGLTLALRFDAAHERPDSVPVRPPSHVAFFN